MTRTIEALLYAILDYAGLGPKDCERLSKDKALRSYVTAFIERRAA